MEEQLIWLVLKPTLKSKFEFKKILNCKFIADRNKNILLLSGFGIDKKGKESKAETEPLILSNHEHYINMFDAKVKQVFIRENIQVKENLLSILTIDFETKQAQTEVFFIDNKNNRVKKTVKLIE